MEQNAIEITRSRLLQHRGKYPHISEQCGASYSWLSKFARGDRGKRPSFERISRLCAVLDALEAEEAGQAANG